MHRKVTSLSSETLKLNIFYSFLKTFSLQIGPRELLRLAHSELQEWQETAHTNSYIPDTTSKCSKCYFQCQVGSSLLIKRFLKTLARLKVANLSYGNSGYGVLISFVQNQLVLQVYIHAISVNFSKSKRGGPQKFQKSSISKLKE